MYWLWAECFYREIIHSDFIMSCSWLYSGGLVMFLIIVFVPIYSSIAIWFIIAFVNQQILLEIPQIPKKIEWCKNVWLWKYSSHAKTRDCYAEIKIAVFVYKSIISMSQFCIPYLLYLIANPKVTIIFWNIDTRVIGVLACENETDWKKWWMFRKL